MRSTFCDSERPLAVASRLIFASSIAGDCSHPSAKLRSRPLAQIRAFLHQVDFSEKCGKLTRGKGRMRNKISGETLLGAIGVLILLGSRINAVSSQGYGLLNAF